MKLKFKFTWLLDTFILAVGLWKATEVNSCIITLGTKTEVKLFEGGKVDFKCPLPKEQTTSSNWFRTPINSDTETPLSNLLDNSDTRIYHFRKLSLSDNGTYYCNQQVRKIDETEDTRIYNITLYVLPNEGEETIASTSNSLNEFCDVPEHNLENLKYILNARASPEFTTTYIVQLAEEKIIIPYKHSYSLDYENIVWYWYQDASKEFYENVSTQTNLYLTDLNANKAGIYAYGISTNASNIYNVIYKLHVFNNEDEIPVIIDNTPNLTAFIGEPAIFECIISDKFYSSGSIDWKYSSKENVPSDNDIFLSNDSIDKSAYEKFKINKSSNVLYSQSRFFSAIMILKNVTKESSGWYSCVVNITGKITVKSTRLNVLDFIAKPNGRNPENYTIESHLDLISISYKIFFPLISDVTFDIEFKKLGRNIFEANGKPLKESTNASSPEFSFCFHPMKHDEDEGWYECSITNKYGKYKLNTYIYVRKTENDENNEKETANTEPNMTMILIILIITTLVFCLSLYACHRIQKKRAEMYAPWIKKIIIEKKVTIDSHDYMQDPLEMPIVKIERQRAEGVRMKSLMTSEYDIPLDNVWEFPRPNLRLGKCLGEGAFGKVVEGQAKGIIEENVHSTVAVKMLKVGYTDSDMINLISEMEIMKMIGKHMNIVNLLGCCSQTGNLLVIMEYACEGNLRDFLRKRRPSSGYENPNTGKFHSEGSISEKTQIYFASQVAEGMEYLASRRCIHRDLAARNVLVCDNDVVKIADFGLARDICNYDYYRKESDGRVPVKWMAPEALFHGVYTSQSDVWSYGVLLWEIMTFGGTPYPSMPNIEKLLDLLKSGYRMEKPLYCTDKIYEIMYNCWKNAPNDRPTFSDLVQELQDYLMENFPEPINYLEIHETSPEDQSNLHHRNNHKQSMDSLKMSIDK